MRIKWSDILNKDNNTSNHKYVYLHNILLQLQYLFQQKFFTNRDILSFYISNREISDKFLSITFFIKYSFKGFWAVLKTYKASLNIFL